MVGSRKEQLVAIAAELFATQGFVQATVRDIADRSGILSGSIYHHFASKEAILAEILGDFMDGLLRTFTATVHDEERPREALEGLVRSSFETIHRTPHAVALYQNETALLASAPQFAFIGKAGVAVEGIWLGVLQAGVDAGDIRGDLDLDVTYRFIRDTVWSSVRWYNPRGRLRHERLAEQFLAVLNLGLVPR